MSAKYTLTIREFSKREGVSVSTLKRRIKKNNISIIKEKKQTSSKGNCLEIRIHYSYLSEENKEAFLREKGLSTKENGPKKEDLWKANNLKPWQKVEADRREVVAREYFEVEKDVPSKKRTEFKKQFAKSKGIGDRTQCR